MVQRTGGNRRKTRNKFKKRPSEKGRINIKKYIQQFNIGDKVMLQADTSIHKGMYFRRFHSKVGVVQNKRGFCYEVQIKDGHKEKIIIVHPVHLLKCQK